MPMGTKATCPYCGNTECDADWVDVGIGYVQCMPYYCDACGACEMGPYDSYKRELTPDEKRTRWYAPGNAGDTSGPTLGGVPLDNATASAIYHMGVLDKKNGDDDDDLA